MLNNPLIVDILKLGVVGLAFLFAYLAYKAGKKPTKDGHNQPAYR